MDEVSFAQLNKEQLQQLAELENKLNVTLVAYESFTKKRAMEEMGMESSLDLES